MLKLEAKPEDVGLSTAGLAAIDASIQKEISAGSLAGAVTLAARHGKICHVHAMGMKDIERGEPSRIDGLYRIFSMTKPVTAVAMMILWDEGRWQPDDPIEKYLPEFKGPKVIAGLDDKGAPRLVPADHPPTLRELMTHTSGLGYGLGPRENAEPVDVAFHDAKVWEAADLKEMMARIGPLPLAYQPGTAWRYSVGMDVQGAIVERLTGQNYAAFLRDRVFTPLGMIDTAFHTPPEKADRLATLYFKHPKHPLRILANPLIPEYQEEPKRALGGAGLISTLSDYARFAQMLLNEGELNGARIISREAAQLMMSNHISQELMDIGFGVGAQQIRPVFGFGFNGVVFTDPARAGVPVGKNTYHWDGAAGTFFWVDRTNDLIFVCMTQYLSYTAPPLQKTAQTLMADALIERN